MIMLVSEQDLLKTAQAAKDLGASVEIVGAWAWARFHTKPSDETREKMKGLGYHWSKAKCRWYFMGSISTAIKRHSWAQITARYAPLSLDEAEGVCQAA